MTDDKLINKKSRGFTDDASDSFFMEKPVSELIALLKSKEPADRTCGAKILGKRKERSAIQHLCEALSEERKLYSKIAISEALGSMGKVAVPFLIPLLGKIGNNQHKMLPQNQFKKSSYPLPRDMAARTIIKIGAVALPDLEEVLLSGDISQVSEAIDAIGHIAFYSGNRGSLDALWECLNENDQNSLITWKIVRAFQAFPESEVVAYLEGVVENGPELIIRLEAQRSLHQIINIKQQ